MDYRSFYIEEGSCALEFRDYTDTVIQEDIRELGNFVFNDILSTPIDVEWLGVIKIRNDGDNGYLGSWRAQFDKNEQNPQEIKAVVAVIILNYYYHRFPDTPSSDYSLARLKETLAHEYGHHWTLLHCIQKYGLPIQCMNDIFNHPLPKSYYKVRGLNYQDYSPNYAFEWHRCDKEIIAEDYRILFAPEPHNKDHQCIIRIGKDLDTPSEKVEHFIRNLNTSIRFSDSFLNLIERLWKFIKNLYANLNLKFSIIKKIIKANCLMSWIIHSRLC